MFVCVQVTQLEELLAVRHSVFVVGGPGTGKSQVNFYITTVSIKHHIQYDLHIYYKRYFLYQVAYNHCPHTKQKTVSED